MPFLKGFVCLANLVYMDDLKEVKNINAEEVDQKAIKSFFGNVNYAPKKVKEVSSRQVSPQRLTEKSTTRNLTSHVWQSCILKDLKAQPTHS